jgi:hypothetical protein
MHCTEHHTVMAKIQQPIRREEVIELSFSVRRGCPSFEPPQGGRITPPRCLRPADDVIE